MLDFLRQWFTPDPAMQLGYGLYQRLTAEARDPELFAAWGVPDTLDGRFEMVLLHLFLYLHTLKTYHPQSEAVQSRMIEAFFADMDRSVRELGVSDSGVGKRMKKMGSALYGRLHAYSQAVTDETGLRRALYTNLYGTVAAPPADISAVTAYMHQRLETLARSGVPGL